MHGTKIKKKKKTLYILNGFHRFCPGMQWEVWYRYFLICIINLFVSELTNCVGYIAYDGMTIVKVLEAAYFKGSISTFASEDWRKSW